MSKIDLIIEERPTDIGDFLVGRLLPFRKKRHVGPFVFIDHMGPADLNEDENLEVGPHPHIGLSTLTFLFDGNIVHRDSLGTQMEIKAGAVNWMTAGKGIVHSERTPDRLRTQKKKVHGLQIWVALPKELEDSGPTFSHTESKDIPSWSEGKVDYKLIAGEVLGQKSPVPVHSDLYFMEIKAHEDTNINIGDKLFGESALYILEGRIRKDDNTFGPKQILVAKQDSLCEFTIEKGSTIYIFGGTPFPEERFIHWNFVSSSKDKIEKAREDWKGQKFDKIPGDEDDFVPLPGS